MRLACLLLVSTAVAGCSPVVDLELYNDTGREIFVSVPAATEQLSIQPHTAQVVSLVVPRAGLARTFSVSSSAKSWMYPGYLRVFASVPFSLRERRSLGAQRIHAKVDSRGRIFLTSPKDSGVAVPTQPPGFPMQPNDSHQT